MKIFRATLLKIVILRIDLDAQLPLHRPENWPYSCIPLVEFKEVNMSSKNKLRFLICFLFSTLAHSSVLVASLFFSTQAVEDPQGATLKEAAQSSNKSSSKDQTVELVDLSQSKSAIPDSVQVAELVRTLPVKSAAQKEILLAKEDDATAVEIKKPVISKELEAEAAPVSVPTPKLEKKIAKTKPKKQTKIAKIEKQKIAPKKIAVETPLKAEVVKPEMIPDTVIAQNEELTPVKEHVDAEANEEVAASESRPVVEPKKQVFVSAPSEVASNEASAKEEASSGQSLSEKSNLRTLQGDGDSALQGNGFSGGGAPQGIRDGDSLAELSGNIRPLYPLEDRRAKREGTAVFVARVTSDGKIKDIKLEGSATPAMNAAAQKAFANYHYKAGQEGWIRKKFVFKITGETEEASGLRRTSQNNATSW